MKAIIVTQELKHFNGNRFNLYSVGQIKPFERIPFTFAASSSDYRLNRDYRNEEGSVHYLDGFKDLVKPELNKETHKTGSIILDSVNDEFTYEVLEMDAKEISSFISKRDKSDFTSKANDKRKTDGIEFFDYVFKRIQRGLDKGNLTPAQAKNIAQYIYKEIEPLYKGLWIIAKINLAPLDVPSDNKEAKIFIFVESYITNYLMIKQE